MSSNKQCWCQVLNRVLSKHMPFPASSLCSVCVDEIVEGKNVVVRDLYHSDTEVTRLRILIEHAIGELPKLGASQQERAFQLWQKLMHESYPVATKE